MNTYEIRTSNGNFYQIHHVTAATEAEAKRLAEEASDKALAEEHRNDAIAGLPPSSPYKVFKVTFAQGLTDGPAVRFIDAGSEG